MDNKWDTIYNIQNLKETEELIEIWQKHDLEEWSEEALEVIQRILIERLGALPEEPTSLAMADEFEPEFYDPNEVERFVRSYKILLILFFGLITISSFLRINVYKDMARSLVFGFPSLTTLVWIIIVIVNIIITFFIYFIPFSVMRIITQILRQMEQNSRAPLANAKIDYSYEMDNHAPLI